MTVKTKSHVKAGRNMKLASWFSLSGALAVVLFGGPIMVAEGRSESNSQAAPTSTIAQTEVPIPPPGTDTQGPNSAPTLPSDDQSPAPMPTEPAPDPAEPSTPDTNVDPSTPEADDSQTPSPTDTPPTQGPNTAPDVQQIPDSTSESAQPREENIVFVRTAEGASTGEVVDNPARFNQIVGSGRLIVNGDDQVTGYYFTVSGLPPSQALPYHFHSARNGSTPTSCEGDKGIVEDEAAGAVITPLSDVAPLQSTATGIGIVGTASSPIQLPTPVPLADIGYLNIHADPSVTSGIVCANVPLQPISFTPTETPIPESSSAPAPGEPSTDVDPSTPEADDSQTPPSTDVPSMEPQNPPTQGPNTAPQTP